MIHIIEDKQCQANKEFVTLHMFSHLFMMLKLTRSFVSYVI